MTNVVFPTDDIRVDEVWYSPVLTVMCSIGNLPFRAKLEIVYSPRMLLLEFMAFDRWLDELVSEPTTIEALVSDIADFLLQALSPKYLRVTCKAKTSAHARTTVSRTHLIERSRV